MNCYPVVKKGSKSRKGRGFSQGELKEVGLSLNKALRIGIPIDSNRSTKHSENVKTLKTHLNIEDTITEFPLDLTEVKGIGQKISERLKAAGFDSVKRLAESKPEEIAEKIRVSEKRASTWIENASEILLDEV